MRQEVLREEQEAIAEKEKEGEKGAATSTPNPANGHTENGPAVGEETPKRKSPKKGGGDDGRWFPAIDTGVSRCSVLLLLLLQDYGNKNVGVMCCCPNGSKLATAKPSLRKSSLPSRKGRPRLNPPLKIYVHA